MAENAGELPTGTLTFLLTDVEGSTRLWEQYPRAMRTSLAQHDAITEQHVLQQRGYLVRPRGEGDSRFAVFARASDAVGAACAIQLSLAEEPSALPERLRVRMALHTGETELVAGDYYGTAVNRCARLRALAHGDQILLSGLTARLVRGDLPEGASLRALGTYQLKDLTDYEVVFQVVHPRLRADFPPLVTVASASAAAAETSGLVESNAALSLTPLPSALTSFVGREREMAEAARLLAGSRLLTLTGTGGVGKTRLSLEVATRQQPEFADGVAMVELAALADPELVTHAVGNAIGVHELPPLPLVDRVVDALRGCELLLVLDNCEHLVQSCAELADRLLRECPALRILATSREPLGIAGETVWRVPSLSIGRRATAAGVNSSDAARLFIERAQAALPEFAVTDRNAPAIARLCRRLDGIALALELAAAWVPVLSIDQITERLDDALRLLVTGSRAAPVRQQTLRATLDWSFTLLPEAEQRLFERLAVFSGGWSLTDAEMVCADIAIPRASLLELLAQLVKKSLVLTESDADGSVRYRFLEPVRQYARERFDESADVEDLQRRHAAYFLEVAQRADVGLRGPDQRLWLKVLEHAHDNMRAALGWAERTGDAQIGHRLAGSLSRFWAISGYMREGLGWLECIGADDGEPAAREKVLHGLGWLAMLQGDLPRARHELEAALALARELRDTTGIEEILKNVGRVALDEGDLRAANNAFSESLMLARSLGHGWSIAFNVTGLAQVALLERDLDRAHTLFAQGLTAYRLLDSSRHIAVTLSNLATVMLEQESPAEAHALFVEALDLVALDEDPTGLAHVLSGFAALADTRGNYQRGQELRDAALGVRATSGNSLASDHAWPEAPLSTITPGRTAPEQIWLATRSWTFQEGLAEATEEAGRSTIASA
jgi:predicted ATPase/class 3 adenylate cyclase